MVSLGGALLRVVNVTSKRVHLMLNLIRNLHVNFPKPARADQEFDCILEYCDHLRMFAIIASCDQIETNCFHLVKTSATLLTRRQGVCDPDIDGRPYLCLS